MGACILGSAFLQVGIRGRRFPIDPVQGRLATCAAVACAGPSWPAGPAATRRRSISMLGRMMSRCLRSSRAWCSPRDIR
jgi:hypothetical protein